MSENVIKYKGQYLSYSKIADEIIMDYGCNNLKQLPTLIYLGTSKMLCEAELAIIRDCYMTRVCSIKNLMSYYS